MANEHSLDFVHISLDCRCLNKDEINLLADIYYLTNYQFRIKINTSYIKNNLNGKFIQNWEKFEDYIGTIFLYRRPSYSTFLHELIHAFQYFLLRNNKKITFSSQEITPFIESNYKKSLWLEEAQAFSNQNNIYLMSELIQDVMKNEYCLKKDYQIEKYLDI
jgi:hypothetical protein